MVAACVVTFDPDLHLLGRSLVVLAETADRVIVVDNGSDEVANLREFCSAYPFVELILNGQNLGIATALNQGLAKAAEVGAAWVLTLDQDSTIQPDLVPSLLRGTTPENVGVICPIILDAFAGKRVIDPRSSAPEFTEVRSAITSGSLVRVKTWIDLKGFNEWMFIDFVDFEFCYRARASGYVIRRSNIVGLPHRLGRLQRKTVLGRTLHVTHHSPRRLYYLARNAYYTAAMHPAEINRVEASCTVAKAFLKVLIFERQKLSKMKSLTRGSFAGLMLNFTLGRARRRAIDEQGRSWRTATGAGCQY